MTEHKILFSARDPGSVGHIAALAKAFRTDKNFIIEIVASGSAVGLLHDFGESPHRVLLPDGRDFIAPNEDPTPLLETTRKLFKSLQPDVVLVGLSSLGVGIDEALLAVADVPTYAIQDFWGDVNLALEVPAATYLVLDEYAAMLTRDRWDVNTRIVGSPKHAEYANKDILEMRRAGRTAVGASPDTKLVGFFAQTPEIPGHEQSYQELIRAVSELVPSPKVLLREHPKFDEPSLRKQHQDFASRYGVNAMDVTDHGDVETWLATCDVVATLFSVAGLDHAYLSSYSCEPIGTVLYLLHKPESRAYAKEITGLEIPPITQKGVGMVVTDGDRLNSTLERALTCGQAQIYFEASKSLRQQDPCAEIVNLVLRRLKEGSPPARASITGRSLG